MVKTRRPNTKKDNRRARSKPKSGTGSSSRRRPSRKPLDLQEQAFKAFAEQVDSLWASLADQCRQFADGFNRVAEAPALLVEAEPTSLRVVYRLADAELFVQLDRDERLLQAWLNTGRATYGSCVTDQLPVGLTVRASRLHFVMSGEVVSDEHLAVTLLTQLTAGRSEQEPS